MLPNWRAILSLLVLTFLLPACVGFHSTRAEFGTSDFQEDDGTIGSSPTIAVGHLFQDDLPDGNKAEGFVGDAALRATTFHKDLGGANLDGSRIELDLGTRLYPYSDSDFYQPYLGFGGTLQRLHLEDGSDSATTEVLPGVYATAGIDFVIGALRWGVSYRHTFGIDARLGDDIEETELDAGAFLMSVGLSL